MAGYASQREHAQMIPTDDLNTMYTTSHCHTKCALR